MDNIKISKNRHMIKDKDMMEEIYDLYTSENFWMLFIPAHQLTQSNLDILDEMEQKYFTPGTELNKSLRTVTFSTYDVLYIVQKDKIPTEYMEKLLADEIISKTGIIIWPSNTNKLLTSSHSMVKRINDSLQAIHKSRVNGISHWEIT